MRRWGAMLMFGLCIWSFCQMIIGKDGTWGINSSHDTADGTVLMAMCDHAVANM